MAPVKSTENNNLENKNLDQVRTYKDQIHYAVNQHQSQSGRINSLSAYFLNQSGETRKGDCTWRRNDELEEEEKINDESEATHLRISEMSGFDNLDSGIAFRFQWDITSNM